MVNLSSRIKFSLLTLFLAVASFLLGYVTVAVLYLVQTTISIIQVNATYIQANITNVIGGVVTYNVPGSVQWIISIVPAIFYTSPLSAQSGAVISTASSVEIPTQSASSAVLSYGLELAVSYGGVFHINETSIIGEIAPRRVGAGRLFTLNVTVWSPYAYLDVLMINISNIALYEYRSGELREVYDLYNCFTPVGYRLDTRRGWVYFLLTLKPSWNCSGTFNVWVHAEDTLHSYNDTRLFTNLLTIVNETYLHMYRFNRTAYMPGSTALLTLHVAYVGSTVGAVGETVYINGTPYVTDEEGYIYYIFKVPKVPGTYSIHVRLAHGGEYVINYTVSNYILHIIVKTVENRTIHLPGKVTVEVYNYTSGELVGIWTGGERIDVPLNRTGTYLVKVTYHGVTIAELVHRQTSCEERLVLNRILQVVDYAGMLRGLISNVTVTSYMYDNRTRKLTVMLSGHGTGRLIYIVNFTKPLLVLSNTTIIDVQRLRGELIIDVKVPANITVLDPRRLKVTVVNPFKTPFTPTIELLNLTDWAVLSNGTLYTVPAQVETKVKVTYKTVSIVKTIPLLSDLNLTIVFPYAKIVDYRNITRELFANVNFTYIDLSPEYPYSKIMLVLNGSGPFKLCVGYGAMRPTKVKVTGNVSSLRYYWSGEYLVIEGVLGSIGIINITDLYRLKITAYDRLGRRLPSFEAYVDGVMLRGTGSVETYLPPGTHNVTVLVEYSGFRFYAWSSGLTVTSLNVTVHDHDVMFTVYYKVPVRLVDVKVNRIAGLSWILPLLALFQRNIVDVYVEGFLKDYYGVGVPDRTVIINVIDATSGASFKINVTTDASGYFRTPILHMLPNRTYIIKLVYPGDNIYVGTNMTLKITPMSLPEQPTPAPGTVIVPLPALIGAILSAVGIIASLKALSMLRKQRRFVKKRRR